MKNIKKTLAFLLIMSLVLLSVPIKVDAKSVKLNKKSATLYVGKSIQLKLVGSTTKVKWESSNTKVATVSKNGKVKGKKSGKTIITATTNSKSYKCRVTVKNSKKKNEKTVDVSTLYLNTTSIKLVAGSSETLQLTIVPDNATNQTVTWQSSDDSIATVEDGVVSAISAGTAKIFVTSVNGKNASCDVVVVPNYLEEYKKLSAYEKLAIFTMGKIYEKEKCQFTPQNVDIIDYYIPSGFSLATKEIQYTIYQDCVLITYTTPSFTSGIVPYYVSFFNSEGGFVPYGRSTNSDVQIKRNTKWTDNNYRSVTDLYNIYVGLTDLGYDVKNASTLQ